MMRRRRWRRRGEGKDGEVQAEEEEEAEDDLGTPVDRAQGGADCKQKEGVPPPNPTLRCNIL